MPNIIAPVVNIFNLCFKSGYIPESYKCAKVPIYNKSGVTTEFKLINKTIFCILINMDLDQSMILHNLLNNF